MASIVEWMTDRCVTGLESSVEFRQKILFVRLHAVLPLLPLCMFALRAPPAGVGDYGRLAVLLVMLCSLVVLLCNRGPVKSVAVQAEVLTTALLLCVVVMDRGDAATLQLRSWPLAVLLSNLAVVCGARGLFLGLLAGGTVVWLAMERINAMVDLSLYSGEELSPSGVIPACDCSSPPCAVAANIGASDWLLASAVIVVDTLLMAEYRSALRLEEETSHELVTDVAKIIDEICRYRVTDALELLSSQPLPPQIRDGLTGLCQNLVEYRAFLPQVLLSAIESMKEDDDETLPSLPADTMNMSTMSFGSKVRGGEFTDLHTLASAVEENAAIAHPQRYDESVQPGLPMPMPMPRRLSASSSAAGGREARNMRSSIMSASGFSVGMGRARPSIVGSVMRQPVRSRQGTVMLVRMIDPAWELMNEAATAVLEAITHSQGIPSSTHMIGNELWVMGTWNLSKSCSTHQSNACSSAIHSCSDLPAVNFSVACSSGTCKSQFVGTESFRTTVLAGAPVTVVRCLAQLGPQVGVLLLLDERVYSRVRSEFSARIVDAVAPVGLDEEELLVYQLLGRCTDFPSSGHARFAQAFSLMREGNHADASDGFAACLASDPSDTQARRLLRVCVHLAARPDPSVVYLRKEAKSRFQDWEASASLDTLPDRFAGLALQIDSDGEDEDSDDDEETTADIIGLPTPSVRKTPSSRSRKFPRVGSKNSFRRTTVSEDGKILRMRLDDIVHDMKGGSTPVQKEIPLEFIDARKNRYHRSSTRLGKGAFGEVWLGMGDDATMVAVKSLRLLEVSGGMQSTAGEPTWMQQTACKITGMTTGGASADSGPGSNGEELRSRIANMVQEVTLMTSLRHENVVQYLGCAAEGPYVLVIMEYLPGGSLHTLKSQFGGHFPLACVRRFIGDIVRGLAFIHGESIVHRDLKPGNVLVTAEGQARLADFGASAELAAASKGVVGTPLYMAPEQARGKAGHASDIWSLGLILCELLTTDPCYVTKLTSEPLAFMFHLANDGDFMPTVPASVPAEAKEIAVLCLQRDSDLRPTAKRLLSHPFLLT